MGCIKKVLPKIKFIGIKAAAVAGIKSNRKKEIESKAF